jgi:hypothetical protein
MRMFVVNFPLNFGFTMPNASSCWLPFSLSVRRERDDQ